MAKYETFEQAPKVLRWKVRPSLADNVCVRLSLQEHVALWVWVDIDYAFPLANEADIDSAKARIISTNKKVIDRIIYFS